MRSDWIQSLQNLFTIRHQLEEIAAEQTRQREEFARFREAVDARLRALEVAVARLEEGRQTMRAEVETELTKAVAALRIAMAEGRLLLPGNTAENPAPGR